MSNNPLNGGKDLRNVAGPVAHAYETTSEPLAFIVGPTGGGKTESSVRRILQVARTQHPSPKDSVRKCRVVCVGLTYRDLWDKAIPSYLKVFNKALGRWTGGQGDPATHVIDMVVVEPQSDGTTVRVPLHIEVLFRAKGGEQSLEDFVRGLETTCWWLQEADQLPPEILPLVTNRCGRYPEPDDRMDLDVAKALGLPAPFMGVWGDSNKPVKDSWLDVLAFGRHGEPGKLGRGLFLQPPALIEDAQTGRLVTNPKAENLHNLRKINPLYYEDMAAVMAKSESGAYDIGRLLMLKESFDRRGLPVYTSFNAARHAVASLAFDPRYPLLIGADTGNTLRHAAVFGQRVGNQCRFLCEIHARDTCSINAFSDKIRGVISTRFRQARDIEMVVDPAARSTMASQQDGHASITYAQFLAQMLEINVSLASSNDPGLRRSAMRDLLDRHDFAFFDQGQTPELQAALAGGYAYRKVGNAVSPEVNKNSPYSHIAEAAEYLAMLMTGPDLFWGPSASYGAGHGGAYGGYGGPKTGGGGEEITVRPLTC